MATKVDSYVSGFPAPDKTPLIAVSADGWRAALLGGVAMGALLTGGDRALADDICIINGSVMTCTGDQSFGVEVKDSTVKTLQVYNLNQSIRPISGTDGIRFVDKGKINIVADTGDYRVRVVDANGITAQSLNGKDVSVEHNGNIRAIDGNGIVAVTAGSIYVENDGNIKSTGDAIHAFNESADAGGTTTVIQEGKLRSTEGYGMFISGQNAVKEMSRGQIRAELDAIHIVVGAEGDVSVDHKGKLISDTGAGVSVTSLDDIKIKVNGDIEAETVGIYARNSDFATLLQVDHKGDISVANGKGIQVQSTSGEIVINNKGGIDSSGDAIHALNNSDDDTTIDQIGEIISGARGIVIEAKGGDAIVTGTGNIAAQGNGVDIVANSGDASVNQTGDITSREGTGITIHTPDGSASVTGKGSITIQGSGDAINLKVSGSGDKATVDRVGDITSKSGNGIVATASTGGVSITNDGKIDVAKDGINATSTDAQGVTVSQTGELVSRGGRGIYVASPAGPVSVTSTGDIKASGHGVEASSSSSTATVEQTGDISSTYGNAIHVETQNGNAKISGEGTINTGSDGIFISSKGAGSSTVDRSGDITSKSSNGIYAYSSNNVVNVTNVGKIDTYKDGIFARSPSSAVTIVQTGDVTSEVANGIYASSLNANVSVTIKADPETEEGSDISAKGAGIFAKAKGAGNVVVEMTGDISKSATGVYAVADNGTVTVTTVGNLGADGDGIFAKNLSDGIISISHTGDLNVGGAGIYATSSGGDVKITMDDGDVNGAQTGIFASTLGDGKVEITLTGDITNSAVGVYAKSIDGQIDVTTNGDFTTQGDAIAAVNAGPGNVNLKHTGTLTAGGYGLKAYSPTGAVDVKAYGAVDAYYDAISATNKGSEGVTVYHTGDTDSEVANGIVATSSNGKVQVTTKEGDFRVAGTAIIASNKSSQAVSVEVEGDIISSLTGIQASSAQGKVTVKSTGDFNATNDVINASNTGFETVWVNHMGGLTSTAGNGVVAGSTTGAVDVDIWGDLDVKLTAISATNKGDTAVTVDMLGDILASTNAIVATSTTGPVTIQSIGDFNAAGDVITASNVGNTTVKVDHEGDLTSTSGNGVVATSTTGIVDIAVEGDFDVAKTAIDASNVGDTEVKVKLKGDVVASTNAIVASSSIGKVTITSEGDIESTGDAIIASNIGDTEIKVSHTGDLNSSTGNGIVAKSKANGDVTVEIDGGTLTAAKDGVQLKSYGDLSIEVGEDGSIVGGKGYAAINFEQGVYGAITNFGTIENAGGLEDYAIKATQSSNTIDNHGTISGSIDLGTYANYFTNQAGGLFETGAVVNVATDSTLLNHGIVSPGGVDNVYTTTLTGNFTNGTDGIMLFDIDMANGKNDRINVSQQADLDGYLAINLTSLDVTGQTYTIMTAGDGVVTQNLQLDVNPMLLASIAYTSGSQVDLTIDGFDFAPQGLTGNAAEIGGYVGQSISNGSTALYPLGLALLNLGSLEEVNNALNQLSPNVYLDQQMASLYDTLGFSDNLMSCRVIGGINKFGAEGQCVWAKASYRNLSHDGSADATGFDSDAFDLAAGVQYALEGDWKIGAGIGWTRSSTDADNGATGDGNSVNVGAVLKYVPGPLLLAASVSGSYGWYDSARPVNFGNFSDYLEGSSEVGTVNGRLRAAYTMERGDLYVKPQVDANVTYVNASAFTETGGIASVYVNGSNNTVFSVAPSIELGGQATLGNGAVLRPYVKAGVALYSGADFDVQGGFAADTADTDPFTISSSSDDFLLKVSTGFDVMGSDGAALRVFYDGSFGDTTTENAVGLKFNMQY